MILSTIYRCLAECVRRGLGARTIRRQRRARHGLAQAGLLEDRTLLAAIVVNSAADNTTVDSLTTLREAIIAANAGGVGPHTITFGDGSGIGGTNFTDGTADTILLSLGEMAISQRLSEKPKSPQTALATGAVGVWRYLKGANCRAGDKRFSMRWTALHWMRASEDAVVRS